MAAPTPADFPTVLTHWRQERRLTKKALAGAMGFDPSNPAIIDASHEQDEQYEVCLSFFDVRGQVPRARRIEVEHTLQDGSTTITVFTDALARLVAHEVDHLHGHTYRARMRKAAAPIPVEEYRGASQAWNYPHD